MNRSFFFLFGSAVCLVSLLITGCFYGPHPISKSHEQIDAEEISISNNLVCIWSLLHNAAGDRDRFPNSLSELKLSPQDEKLFVYPCTGSRPGTPDTIEEWTDYIYVGGVWDGVPKTALIISPPENHQGKYGYVLCVGLWVFRLPPDQVRMLVKEPWLLATNTPPDNVNYLKKQITVHVPKRLQKLYPEAYNSGI